jgi:Mrp family chromosome partitioning ATPase
VTVGVGRSTLGMVRRALSELDQVDANIIGVVLNGIKHTRGGYMAKNFALYDKYAKQTNGHALEEPLPEMQIEDDGDRPIEAAVVLIPSDSTGNDDPYRDDRND